MKKVLGYTVAFLAGTLFSGGVALAATNYVQAIKGTSVIELNGSAISSPPKLVYGGTTYVQLYSIQQGLKQVFGTQPTWNGNTFNIITAQKAATVVGVSQLPYTFTSPDGYKVTFNSVSVTAQATVLNVTVSNAGTKQDASQTLFDVSSISDGGAQVAYQSQDDAFYQSPNLQPGQSVTGNVTYDPLTAGASEFTLYFEDFDFNTHSITFDLSK